MKLSEEQTTKTLDFLESVWPDPKICAVCKNTSWNLLEMVFEIRETGSPGQDPEENTAIPLVAITCKSCGNTVFFNAMAAGILPEEHLEDH